MIETYAPVAVFAYNRLDKLYNCIRHLEKCIGASDTELFLFCDGAKNEDDAETVRSVQEYANMYVVGSVFKNVTVYTQEHNKGLAASIISGVTEIVNRFGSVIVVEDDLVVKPTFLKYMNGALQFYRSDMNCGSICSFSFPMKELERYDKDVYFTRKADCWGWATWADRWNNAFWADTDYKSYLSDRALRRRFEELEAGLDRLMYLQYKGKISSWAVRWIYYLFQKGQLSVYPTKSQVINDGFDGSGTHISGGFGKGFNSDYIDESADFSELVEFNWEKCEINEKLAKACGKFPRRFLPLYVMETIRFMLKKA